MILGLELAFAIAPLVISATEHHQRLYRKLKMIASQEGIDEELEDFLADLHDEISLLKHTLRCLISDLTTLPETLRERLLNFDREQWKQESVNIALKTRLGGDAEIAFTGILNRLLKSLDEVVSEKSLRLISSDVTSSTAFFKLEGFRGDMESGATIHDLRSRFRFTTKVERRTKNIKRISKCNKKLERLIHGYAAGITQEVKKSTQRQGTPPTNRSRRMSHDAHTIIARNWSCPCPRPHEARLGLLKCLMSQEDSNSMINLDLLVSMTTTDQADELWLESRIHILLNREDSNAKPLAKEETNGSPRLHFIDEQEPVKEKPAPRGSRRFIDTESVCTLIKEAYRNDKSLELAFDGEKLWQMRSSGAHVVLKPDRGITLKTVLGDSQSRLKLKLKEKRALAVVLAHAILHYCDSPWVSDNWNKEHVNFFSTVKGPDLMRPYLATQFEPLSTKPEDTTNNMYSHPSPALLSLGILLLELYLSKPIESLREMEDTEDGLEDPNINWFTAEKQLDKMGDDLYEGYRNAIQACLKIDYVGVDDNLSLDDEGFRKLIFERVVIPLEDELKNGFHITPEDLGVL